MIETVSLKLNCGLEFRSSRQPDGSKRFEIVEYLERGGCIVVCWYTLGSEGYSIKFVGDRPFHVSEDVFKLMRIGQKIADIQFDLLEKADAL